MNKPIKDFYTKLEMNPDAVERIITTSKTIRLNKTYNKVFVTVSTSVAALLIAVVSIFLLNSGENNVAKPQSLTNEVINQFDTLGNADNVLTVHDDYCLWMSGAYFNGEKMYLALTGEYVGNKESGLEHNTLKFEFKNNNEYFVTVNDEEFKVTSDAIVLEKDGKYFNGVVVVDAPISESIVKVKLNIPFLEVYENMELITTAKGPFEVEDIVSRVYTKNEEKLLNGENEPYITHVAAHQVGVYNEPEIGLSLECYLPKEGYYSNKIKVVVYNEDGSEVPIVQEHKLFRESKYIKSASYGFPKDRNIRVALIDIESGNLVQEYEVYLNDPSKTLAVDE